MQSYLKHIAIKEYFKRRDSYLFLFYDQIHVIDFNFNLYPKSYQQELDILVSNNLLIQAKEKDTTIESAIGNNYILQKYLDLQQESQILLYPALTKEYGELQIFKEPYKQISKEDMELYLGPLLNKMVDSTPMDPTFMEIVQLGDKGRSLKPLIYLHHKEQELNSTTRYFPMLNEGKLKTYTQLINGFVLNLLGISIPELPVKDLISFKHEHFDKLRRFRVSINALANTHDDELPYVIEELSLALKDYNNSVERYSKKTSLSKMAFAINIVKDIPKLAVGDFSSISNSIQFRESQIIDTQSLRGHKEASYLYELQNSLYN